ncbi:hypothetical protein BAE44_0026424 [Dichanthelium oligosanthes]|uniref:Uncharacterized protein n=1 Tax=Dichanthelium oligosanthes TaxID=888268 RepID=A0A1E5UI54_9POAL|nr:hypothetical protein BAE44_0026424 [Dichanthelium oligosanthes]
MRRWGACGAAPVRRRGLGVPAPAADQGRIPPHRRVPAVAHADLVAGVPLPPPPPAPAAPPRRSAARPLPLLDDLPDAIILQPQKKLRYTHLSLVATDPAVRLALNLPLLSKYTDGDRFTPLSAKLPPSTPIMELGDHAAVFFERTVPMLDFTIAASHGRLLLGRGRTRYFVCNPAANRWLALPPPATIPLTRDTACGFHYDVDAASGRISFTVVLLARVRFRRVLVETFSSATGPRPCSGCKACLAASAPPPLGSTSARASTG